MTRRATSTRTSAPKMAVPKIAEPATAVPAPAGTAPAADQFTPEQLTPEQLKPEPLPSEQPPLDQLPLGNSAPIRVELDAAIDGWATSRGFDVLLRGQIISTAPVDSFSIREASGLEVATVQFGQGDGQEAVTMSGAGTEFRTGFQVYLPMPGGDMVRIADMWVSARSRDGAVFETGVRLGCMADQVAVLAGPLRDKTAEGGAVGIPLPIGILYLESAVVDADGELQAHGWTVSASPIVAVQILVDGTRIAAASHGRQRADVAEVYPLYCDARHAGFSLRKRLGGALRCGATVTAQVLCLSGACLATTVPLVHLAEAPGDAAHTELPGQIGAGTNGGEQVASSGAAPADPAAKDREPPARDVASAGVDPKRLILVICDKAVITAAGELLVGGWAACGHGIESIAVEVDGQKAGVADYGQERADVAAEYPGMPVDTGFMFKRAIPSLSDGSHEVHIVASSGAGDKKKVTVTAVRPITSTLRFELDNPKTHDGAAVHPITGRLLIEGWALARDGVAGIDVELDGTLIGQAHYGMGRPDVGVAFPAWDGSARSGYNFHCPSRALLDGDHVIRLTARSKTGETSVHAFRITVAKTDDPEAAVAIRRRIRRVEQMTTAGVLEQLAWRPAFHLIVTGGGSGNSTGDTAADETAWALSIRSIVEQTWPDWRATVLARDASDAETARAFIQRLAGEHASRFAVTDPSDAMQWRMPLASISHLANISEAPLIAVLALGDELGRDALAAFAVATGIHPSAECLYADEFREPPGGERPEAFFKPDFSPALLLSTNYIGRPLVLRHALLADIDATPCSLMRDGFHDLALRCTEAAAETYHVSELLSRTDRGVAPPDGDTALRNAVARRNIDAEVLPGSTPGTWHVKRAVAVTGKVSVIIPTCAAKGHVETCLKTLRAMTAYKHHEIVCIDNIPETDAFWKGFVREHADKIVELPAPFNWSHFNNIAAAATDGEYLLFLNDDIEIVHPDWLDEMLEAAAWPGVGIVGARLLYPNRTVQHAGMFLGDGMGRHAFRYIEETDPGYFGLALTQREVIAVTGACLLVRRDLFDRLGRFDEAHDVVNNDLDFCLRAHRAGLRTIYTPRATLIHHELASRGHLPDDYETTRFTGDWRALFAAGDPYFNPRLSRYADDYRVDDEGVRVVYGGHPLLDRASVKSILVVKVDHIGDFITSLPAIRRLKAAFPEARLTALVAPASASIASIEAAIDECIPLEFFHARSELGERELTATELDALTARLTPYRFDIAVDLRKHLSTRHLLLCSGARLLAGYDSLESFPWLDVVLEWDPDKALQRKRSHIVDDLVHLAAAIDAACEPGRRLFDPPPAPMALEELPEQARHLFSRAVVAIHPGSGNVMRQWPEKHIPPLIDLLIQRNDVSVLLVGGRDDEAKADAIVDQIGRRDRVGSLAGQVPLADLPRLLAACALFIGGNSGPKHIAAASGVPTIGIHSGVVDPGEWGPMGERAVALYRDMSCAPCYLAKPDDCPRGLACIEQLDPALVHQMARMFLARKLPAAADPGAQPGMRVRRVQVAVAK